MKEWNLNDLYTGYDSEAFQQDFAALDTHINAMNALAESLNQRDPPQRPAVSAACLLAAGNPQPCRAYVKRRGRGRDRKDGAERFQRLGTAAGIHDLDGRRHDGRSGLYVILDPQPRLQHRSNRS